MKFAFDNHLQNDILQINRLAPRSYFIPYPTEKENAGNLYGAEKTSRCINLNGEWNFCYYKNAYEAVRNRENELHECIVVPSVWQFNGKEQPFYLNVAFPFPATPPTVPDCAPAAVYKKKFFYQRGDDTVRNILTFQGVSAGFDVWLNGQYVGYSQGSHYPAEFAVTDYLKADENEVCVIVYKWTTGSWFECQDMLRSNGIFRSVYITEIIKNGIYDLNWQCRKSGNGYIGFGNICLQKDIPTDVSLRLRDKDGKIVAQKNIKVNGGKACFSFEMSNPYLWSAEYPDLYDLSASVFVDGEEVENICVPVGFRDFTIKNGVFLVNGQPVKCHGVNHHDTTPDRGCAMSLQDYETDFSLMKSLNIDTIRFSHYPPAPEALELCDRLGFYVIDEADLECHGALFMEETLDCFSKDPQYEKEFLDRIQRLYQRDKYHASVMLWSLGNESGFGENHKAAAAYLKLQNPDLLIHYEGAWNWEGHNGFDVVSMMYPSPERMKEMMREQPEKPLFLCEYAHAMGVGPGGLKGYWETIDSNERAMGGCIWEWCDHAYYAPKNTYFCYGGDGGEWLHDGNFCADGVVRADRNLTPAAFEVANVYRPFCSVLEGNELTITNRNSFTSSSAYDITLIVTKDGRKEEIPFDKEILPGQSATFNIKGLTGQDTALSIVYKRDGRECGHEQHIVSRSFPEICKTKGKVAVCETEQCYRIRAADAVFCLNKDTFSFDKLIYKGKNYLSDQPSLFYNPFCPVPAFVPNIYRYKIDNDKTANEEWIKYGYNMMWNRVTAHEIREYGDCCEITVESLFSPPKLSLEFTHKFKYLIYPDGSMKVQCRLNRKSKNLPFLPRYGILMNLNETLFDTVYWNGLGPNENYPDFRECAVIGEYKKSIREMFYEYAYPQENGERGEVTKLTFKGKGGEMLHFYADGTPFSFRVSDFSCKALSGVRHIGELKRGDKIELSLDGFVSGVGSNSCGPELDDKYKISANELNFSFTMKFE